MVATAQARADSGSHNALIVKVAEKFSIDTQEFMGVLKETAFKQANDSPEVTDAQMYALLVVADQYNLNPFTKEIYAFPDKRGGIVPVVGVDGWNRIANEHSNFDGVEFAYSPEILQADSARAVCPAWIEAKVYRKDRNHPVVVREYLDECYRHPYKDLQTGYESVGPWQTHPKRMLRHKALIQCYRVAFAFVGIYDEDEATRIIDAQNNVHQEPAKVIPIGKATEAQAIEQEEPEKISQFAIDFDQASVDDFISRLCDRAKGTGQWQAAKDLLNERLKGNALIYASEKLEQSIEELKSDVDTDNEPQHQTEQVTDEHREQSIQMFKMPDDSGQGSMF
tara:strand:- start:29301 stop:30314 length:1014 start_codon:yes stop_codon:yes gene_type:complete